MKKRITFNRFELPDILYPKSEYILIHKNKENVDTKNITFKFYKNKNILEKLSVFKKLHKKHVKKICEIENVLINAIGREKFNRLSKIWDYDNFTSNRNIRKNTVKSYNIDENEGWTNAWRKMYEMIEKLHLIHKKKDIKKFRHFDMCGFPGAFIYSTQHYIKTKTKIKEYDWYIQSYNDKKNDSEYLKKTYTLHKKYKDKFLYGSIRSGYNGDISDVHNIRDYMQIFKNKKIDLTTSDCGLNIEWCESYKREIQMIKIHLGQFVCGLAILKKNGNFVMKNYSQMRPLSISIIVIMTLVFKEVYFVKPESSRLFNMEIYLVGKKYMKNLNEKQLDQLLKCVEELDNTKNIHDMLIKKKYINKEILDKIENVLSKYYDQLEKIKEKRVSIMQKEFVELIKKKQTFLMLPKAYHLKKSMDEKIKIYFDDYFKRMKYKKIKNEDKL